MKIFPPVVRPTSFEEICQNAQCQLEEIRKRKPQELVAVPGRMGGWEMTLRDVPEGEEFKLVR